jgi:cell fate regulator YaaT (PSP1 superfamily)
MSIFPLPIFEADADPARRSEMSDAEVYARLKPPTSIVVRVGALKHVAELRYSGDAKPGCGSKLVARTWRGTEIVEMLTTTCSNSGCGKSVSRQEMLEYIENSGGRDYPFHTEGQILRVATVEDLNKWSEIQSSARTRVADVKRIVVESALPMKVVDIEPIFGGELLTVYFLSETRVDFRDLVRALAAEFHTRIEMRQVGARDEARLVADYERCGQHCCCKNFLKVLKPVSMRSAKTQKATLDPLKISGRCGRLMCCLRYEDETYEDLKKRLPKPKTRVGTVEGPGIVIDSKILVQLVLVQLEADGREIAVPVEELCDPDSCPQPSAEAPAADPLRGLSPDAVERRTNDGARRERGERSRERAQDAHRRRAESAEPAASGGDDEPDATSNASPAGGEVSTDGEPARRRRRRRRGRGGDEPRGDERPTTPNDGVREFKEPPAAGTDEPSAAGQGSDGDAGESEGPESPESGGSADEAGAGRRRRRRRRRRRGGGGPDGGSPTAPSGDGGA